MPTDSHRTHRHPQPPHALPRLPGAVLRALLPVAERDEVLADLAEELSEREAVYGRSRARLWVWRQVAISTPALLRRSWWRGWSGFEPKANQMRPGGPSMEGWIMDVRYAARRLARRPLYALLATLTLALGIGGTAAIYGIAKGILLERLPYRAEEEIALFWHPFDWTEEEFLFLRDKFAGFSGVAAYRPEDATLELGDAPARLLDGISSSSEIFDVLGVRPMIGRAFQPGDDALNAEPVAILSYGLWQELGGDRAILGQRIRLDGVQRTIVGVMPRGFWFPEPTVRVYLPEPLNPESRSGNYAFVGRVAPGQQVEAMGASLAALRQVMDERFDYPPQWDKLRAPELTPIRTWLIGPLRPALIATLAAMAVILLIACANVAALMLGQVEGRTTELAVRSALGANRRRLTQQIVAEAVLIGVLAGAVGALLAAGSFRILVGALPLGAWGETASLDWTVFFTAMAVAVLAGLLVALVPSISLWRGDLRDTLGSVRTGGIAGRGGRLEGGLVVAEVALAVLMAAGAGLLIRSVTNLYAIDPGVETEGVGVVDIAMPADMPWQRRQQSLRELRDALKTLPGVREAAATHKLPLRGGGSSTGMGVEGRADEERTTTFFRFATPGYFDALGIAVKQGRVFNESDRSAELHQSGEGPIVINEALAKKYFPDENPIGRRVATGFGGWGRIVGIVENVAEGSLTDEAEPARYLPYDLLALTFESQTLVFRTAPGQDPVSVLDAARRTVQRLTPGIAVQEATTMERVFARAVGPVRQVMTLVSLLTGLALVLGAIGIYGVISHFVGRRKRDWGVRIALGMAPSNVVTSIVARGTRLVAAGVVIGIIAFVLLARLLASFLYGVGSGDPMAMGVATVVLLLVGVLAALLPALRASRTDPATVLREQ